jgi:three-Cys-motif partner protein
MGTHTHRPGATAPGLSAEDVADYLAFYARALAGRHRLLGCFDAITADAWAASGEADAFPTIATRLLEAPDTPAHYAFSDPDPRRIHAIGAALDTLRATRLAQALPTPSVALATQDAAHAIADACAWVHHLRIRHGVIFLDPVGTQLEWHCLRAIATARRLDVWVLIPTAPATAPQSDPQSDPDHTAQWQSRLDRFLGDPGWSDRLLAQLRPRPDRPLPEPRAIDHIERAVIERLRSIFPPHAIRPAGLRLAPPGGEKSLLLFACADPNTRAQALALKAADYLVSRPLRPRATPPAPPSRSPPDPRSPASTPTPPPAETDAKSPA